MTIRFDLKLGLLALVGASLTTACTPFALSPPARTMPLESSATLREGMVGVQVQGGAHSPNAADVGSVGARLRAGLHDLVELQSEATYVHLAYADGRDPHLGMARLGLKIAPIPHVAFT